MSYNLKSVTFLYYFLVHRHSISHLSIQHVGTNGKNEWLNTSQSESNIIILSNCYISLNNNCKIKDLLFTLVTNRFQHTVPKSKCKCRMGFSRDMTTIWGKKGTISCTSSGSWYFSFFKKWLDDHCEIISSVITKGNLRIC